MIRDFFGGNLGDVARDLTGAKVGSVGLLRKLVPLAGENAAAASPLKSSAHSSDTGEEVDELEF